MKNNLIKFRCSDSEREMIDRRAVKSGLSVSAYCREQALKGTVFATPKLSPEEVSFFKALTEHNRNWARITNLVRIRSPHLEQEIAGHLERSKSLIQRFF